VAYGAQLYLEKFLKGWNAGKGDAGGLGGPEKLSLQGDGKVNSLIESTWRP